jgi:hypothetical protein
LALLILLAEDHCVTENVYVGFAASIDMLENAYGYHLAGSLLAI